MLVLSRRKNERIVIGQGDSRIEIVLLEIKSNYAARLGIIAPKHMPVHRAEIRELIDRQKEDEAKTATGKAGA